MEFLDTLRVFLAQWGIDNVSEEGLLYSGLLAGGFALIAAILIVVALIQMSRARRSLR